MPKTTSDSISYIYTADGQKVAKRLKTNGYIYYAGSMVYDSTKTLQFILNEEGRVTKSTGSFTYEYHLKDHLGNTRVAFIPNGAGTTTLQIEDYYAFGSSFTPVVPNNDNKYLYNGKEKQDDRLGGVALDWYDYGARFYDPQIGRWHVIDRLTEKFINNSPYNYALNNPISNIDINGDTTFRYDVHGKYLGMYDLDLTGIRGAVGEYKTYTDVNGNEYQDWSSSINFIYNDPSFDKAQLLNMKVGDQGLMILTDGNINALMNDSKAFHDGNPITRMYAVYDKSRTGKVWDYSSTYLLGAVGINSANKVPDGDTKGGFVLFGDSPIGYNMNDAGNWLWGQAMKRVGVELGTAKIGAHLNSKFIDKAGWDSQADQNAMGQGHIYDVKTNIQQWNKVFLSCPINLKTK